MTSEHFDKIVDLADELLGIAEGPWSGIVGGVLGTHCLSDQRDQCTALLVAAIMCGKTQGLTKDEIADSLRSLYDTVEPNLSTA